MKKGLVKQFIFFAVSFIALLSVSFAWFNMSQANKLGGAGGGLDDLNELLVVEVKRNNREFKELDKDNDLSSLFLKTMPGEFYTFKISVINDTSKDRSVSVMIENIHTLYNLDYDPDELFNLLDVFYIVDGKVTITNDGVDESLYLTQGQDFYLSDLVDNHFNLVLIEELVVLAETDAYISFTVSYDIGTENITYQYNALKITTIKIDRL